MVTDPITTHESSPPVERILAAAADESASDVHFEPVAEGYEVRLRVDGLLRAGARLDAAAGRTAVNRLMVMAELLTYRLGLPQEGRLSIRLQGRAEPVELRLAIMPTVHGLRATIRLPAELTQPRSLGGLSLPERATAGLLDFAAADTGMLLVTGPAGSGKTTTVYALLEEIAGRTRGLSVISLEDPVERRLRGVTQIEVSPFGELTYERVLRSILRQDPQVLALGEIRDGATAAVAAQAALSGHRLVCTLHAGTPGGALLRLLEMGVEPCQLTSSVLGVMSLRLVRKGDGCGGYRGRLPLAEYAPMDEPLRRAVLERRGAQSIDTQLLATQGHQTLAGAAADLVDMGQTDDAEVTRVLGPTWRERAARRP